MTASELWNAICKDHQKFFCHLFFRWQHEHEYEDIQDYLLAVQKIFPEAYKIKAKPFTVYIKTSDGRLEVKLSRKGEYIALAGTTVVD